MKKMRLVRFALAAIALIAGSALARPFFRVGDNDWTAEERATLASMRLRELPPPTHDPSNAYDASPAAADLGRRIFFDKRFSSDGRVSCASCHQPTQQFQDGRPVGVGVGVGLRRTMPLAGAAYNPFLFWDGRKDSMWSQALGPLEAPLEHGGNRLMYARLMRENYRQDYEAVFGPMPQLEHLPTQASPLGTPAQQAAWQSINPKARQEISRVFANIGKALAAYEKTIPVGETRVDRYIDHVIVGKGGDNAILRPEELRGLRLFIGKANCATCHNGPLLTDEQFHNIGVPLAQASTPDHGRSSGITALLKDEFNCLGEFSDAKPDQCDELNFVAKNDPAMNGAFRTPGLRNVAARAPYMHAGQMDSLSEVIRHYNRAPSATIGHSELKPLNLSDQEMADIVAFLAVLNAETIDPNQPVKPANKP